MRIVLFVIILMSADDDEMENSLCVCAKAFYIVILCGWWGRGKICWWNICGLCNAFKVMDRFTYTQDTST